MDVSSVWDAFLTLLPKFQCDLGACACCSHICRNGHMSNLFHYFLCGLCQSLEAWPTDRSRETCRISKNANCAGLRFRCSTLICMQTHRKTRSANELIWQGGKGARRGHSCGAVAVAAAACRGPCTETPHGTEAAMQRSLRQAASLPFKLQHATEGKRICNNYRQRQGA